jgi:predicted RNA-binding Zn-ribbon protein involved in translation (DUF1610 family)
MASKFHEGYIMVDHRASPGVSDEQARAWGRPAGALGEGKLFETATMHCSHCGAVVIMNPGRTRDREWCTICDKYVCDQCGLERKGTGYIHQSYQSKIDYYRNLGEKLANG